MINPGFEALDGDGLPSGWYTGVWMRDPVVSFFSMTEEGRTGRAAVVENTQGNDARFAQNVPVEPDSLYRLSGWVRAADIADSGRGANLSVEGVFVFSASVFGTTDEWVFVELYGRTGPEQDMVTVFARLGGYSGLSTGWAAFDDLCFEKVENVPAGVKVEPFYTEPVAPVADAGAEDATDAVAAPFWPWTLVFSGVYVLLAFLGCRWLCRDASGDLRQGRHAALTGERLLLPLGLAAAAVVRIIIALLVTGYQVDVNCFISWGATFANYGPWGFYQATSFCDYPPGYLYVMGFNEGLYRLLGGALPAAFIHKLIPMACDLLAAALVYRLADDHGCGKRQASLAALLVAFNPAVILNSAAWCQVDSVLCLLLMLVAYLAMREKWHLVLPVYVAAILIKPQALMMGFLGLAAIIIALVHELPRREKNRLVFPRVWKQMGWGLLWSLLTAAVIVLPAAIGMGGLSWLTDLYGRTLASYPYATVNTANLYYLFGGNWQSILYPASTGVTLLLLTLCALWCVVTFLRRREEKMTWLEPAITLALVIGLALIALGVFYAGSEDGCILSIGNPWTVYSTGDGYVREYIPGVEGAWAMQLSPVALLLAGVLFLVASGLLMMLLRLRIRDGLRERVCLSLVEPVLMLLFTTVLAFMLVFDTTWGALGTVMMALAFAIVLPMFVRSGKLHMLPLCGAVLFILLYVFGVKMHERYLFPALFLLGMACVIRRDRRLVWLLAGFSCTVFINAAIVLDNSIRLGSSMGHLNADTHTLACLVSMTNVALAVWSVWLCQRICAEGEPLKLTGAVPSPLAPVEVLTEHPCTPLNYTDTHKVKWGRLDAILVSVVTLLYAIVTLTTLGSTKAPQTAFSLHQEDSQVVIDLGAYHEDFTFLYNAQVSYRDFTIETSDDGETWTADRLYWAQMAEGECFRWKYLTPYYMNGAKREFYGASDLTGVVHLSGRYVRITAQRQYKYDETYYPIEYQAQEPLVFNELLFRNAAGEAIGATIVSVSDPHPENAANLLDEPDTLDGEPGWWNSTYFDEIYHARTGFEHATGQDAYEWTHPPLGKVIMSWFIQLFGMTPFGWRFAGAMAGVLMLPAMYAIAKQLTKKTSLAFAAMFLMAVDCMHFTQTRIATIDSYPVLFIILSWWFMLRFVQRDIVVTPLKKLLPDLALSGFFMGCGVASKWIGVYSGIGLAVVYFWACGRAIRVGLDAVRMKRTAENLTETELELLNSRDNPAMKRVIHLCLWCLLFFVAVPLAIYLGSYVVHYQAREVDGVLGWLQLVWETQINIINYHGTPGLGMDHAYYSPWYEWFTMQTPMYYASPSFVPDGWRYAIYCFGNPIVWYAGLAGMVYVGYLWVRNHRYALNREGGVWQVFSRSWDIGPAFVLIGFAAQILPWVLVPRGTYIYHYFASVPFLILGLVLALDKLSARRRQRWMILGAALLAAALVMFVFLFPYASGMLAPTWWMDAIRNYPWKDGWLGDLMMAIPLVPNVW
ncbi:MAG: phospholipid carrier-dependent glycosyltransferase [Clostridia bacterium]|nr:phospholipid carrier-dependent glycosyltransferase [Clostridia bacterium]